MSIEDKIAAVLRAHQPSGVINSKESSFYCTCDALVFIEGGFAGTDPIFEEHESALAAHQAALLAPLMREAQAEAWRDALDHVDPYLLGVVHRGAQADNPYRIEKDA